MLRYFYSVDDRTRIGPVTLETLRAKAVAGELLPEHFVFVEGAAAWTEARLVEGLFPSGPSGDGAAPKANRAPRPSRPSTLRPIRTSEYASLPRARAMRIARGLYGPPEPCPLRYRAAATIADAAIGGLLLAIAIPSARWIAHHLDAGASAGTDWLVAMLAVTIVPWLYHAGMESSPLGGTLGKIALTIRVVDLRGGRLTFRRATVRHFAKVVSVLPLGAGLACAWLDPRLRTWHDRLTRTAVERTPPV